MMALWEYESSPFDVLGLEWDATSQIEPPSKEEIKKAYRRQAKEKHPDKNPDNPNAKDDFDLLKRAVDFLLDQNKYNVYLTELRSKAFHFSKRKAQKESRRKMMEDLERRETEFAYKVKRQKSQQESAREKLMEERERLQKQMQQQKEWLEQTRKKEVDDDVQSQLKRTFKVSWDRRCGQYTGQQLRQIFQVCGEIEDVVVTTSKKKKGSALIIMQKEESLKNIQAQGHFGDIENPLLIILGDKNKTAHQQRQNPQNEYKPQSLRQNGFGFCKPKYSNTQFDNLYQQTQNLNQYEQEQFQGQPLFPVDANNNNNSDDNKDCQQQQQQQSQQQQFHVKPLFPVQDQEHQQQQQYQQSQSQHQQFNGQPLFPVQNQGYDQTSQYQQQQSQKQKFQDLGDDGVWKIEEVEDSQVEPPVNPPSLFPIQ